MDLLKEWREVHREAVQLCDAIERLPDECRCGDAGEHLGGRCPCCGERRRAGQTQDRGRDCSELLAGVQAAMSLFCEDLKRIAAPAADSAPTEMRLEVRQGVFLAASDLEHLMTALARVSQSVVGFRRTCAITEMKGVKRHGAALREHCDRLDAELQPAG